MAFAEDYVDVATRLRMFKEKYPEGSLQPFNPERPIEVVTVGEKTFLAYTAAAYRSPDDQRPGIGIAWEPFPGQTPYTRDSEAMNCESSAWGRAIVAALAADTKKGVASADEVRNRQAEREHNDTVRNNVIANARNAIDAAEDVEALDRVAERIAQVEKNGLITTDDAEFLREVLVARHAAIAPPCEADADDDGAEVGAE